MPGWYMEVSNTCRGLGGVSGVADAGMSGSGSAGEAELEGPTTPQVSPCITESSGQYLPEALYLKYTVGQLVDIRVITYFCIKNRQIGEPQGGKKPAARCPGEGWANGRRWVRRLNVTSRYRARTPRSRTE
jgi:hypothetical protein